MQSKSNDLLSETGTNARPLKNKVPLIAGVLGAGALWYGWSQYNNLVMGGGLEWNNWIQLALILLLGVLCLAATVLSLLSKPSGWAVFVTALSLVPLALFFNLVVLALRVGQNLIQGDAKIVDRVLAEPQNTLFVLIILTLLGLLGSLTKKEENKRQE